MFTLFCERYIMLSLQYNGSTAIGFTVNLQKTNLMVMGRRREVKLSGVSMIFDGVELQPQTSVKYLGVEFDKNHDWKKHVTKLRVKCFQALGRLNRLIAHVELFKSEQAATEVMLQQLGSGGALSARRRPYRIKDRRIKRIKEELQSGDYSLDDQVFKLFEQVDGVQKLTAIQLASLFHVTDYVQLLCLSTFIYKYLVNY